MARMQATASPTQTTPQPTTKTRPVALRRALVLLAFVVLLTVGGGVRALSFDGHLPYYDNTREGNMFLLTLYHQGVGDDTIYGENVSHTYGWLEGYPPLYIWLSMGVYDFVDRTATEQWLFPGDYLIWMRAISAVADALTLALLVVFGWQLAGAVAGWVAGVVWALHPLVLAESLLALPDPLVYLCVMLVFTSSFVAWKQENPAWGAVGVVGIVAAVYLKYVPVYTLIPYGVVMLDLLRKKPRQTLPHLVGQVAFGLVAAGYLPFAVELDQLSNREMDDFQAGALVNAVNPARNLNNWAFTLHPIGVVSVACVTVGGAAAYFYSKRRGWRVLDWRPVAVVAVYALLGVMLVSSFLLVTDIFYRQTLPITVALLGVFGAGVAQIAWTLDGFFKERFGGATVVLPVLVGVATMLVAAPLLPGAVAYVDAQLKDDTRYLLWRYTDTNLPGDDVTILMKRKTDLRRVWNRPFSGYDGRGFAWAWEDAPYRQPPSNFAEGGINYYALTQADIDGYEGEDRERLDEYLSQLALLKTFTPSDTATGHTIYFYQMLPPENAVDVPFGEAIALAGYDLSAEAVSPGETLTLRPYWRASLQPTDNYSMFVHLYPLGTTEVVAQFDGSPAAAARLTPTWDDPDELVIGAGVTITVPEDAQPGDYTLALGLYDFTTGQRLLTPNGDHYAITITVD